MPEPHGGGSPSFGVRACAEAKAVAKARIDVEFDRRAGSAQSSYPPLHHRWRRNTVALSDQGESRRLLADTIRVRGVIPIRLNNHPLAGAYGCDALGLRDEPVPGFGAVMHDVSGGFPDDFAESVATQERPDVFHRVELW